MQAGGAARVGGGGGGGGAPAPKKGSFVLFLLLFCARVVFARCLTPFLPFSEALRYICGLCSKEQTKSSVDVVRCEAAGCGYRILYKVRVERRACFLPPPSQPPSLIPLHAHRDPFLPRRAQ